MSHFFNLDLCLGLNIDCRGQFPKLSQSSHSDAAQHRSQWVRSLNPLRYARKAAFVPFDEGATSALAVEAATMVRMHLKPRLIFDRCTCRCRADELRFRHLARTAAHTRRTTQRAHCALHGSARRQSCEPRYGTALQPAQNQWKAVQSRDYCCHAQTRYSRQHTHHGKSEMDPKSHLKPGIDAALHKLASCNLTQQSHISLGFSPVSNKSLIEALSRNSCSRSSTNL